MNIRKIGLCFALLIFQKTSTINLPIKDKKQLHIAELILPIPILASKYVFIRKVNPVITKCFPRFELYGNRIMKGSIGYAAIKAAIIMSHGAYGLYREQTKQS